MPVTFSSYRLGPGQRVSYKKVPPPWDWLLRRENELEPRRSRSQIIFAVLVPPLYVAVQAPAHRYKMIIFLPEVSKQLYKQSSKYLHSYNVLLLVKYFYSRTKCAFVLGGIFPTRCTWGDRGHGQDIAKNSKMSLEDLFPRKVLF